MRALLDQEIEKEELFEEVEDDVDFEEQRGELLYRLNDRLSDFLGEGSSQPDGVTAAPLSRA